MEGHLCANLEKPPGASPPSFIALLKVHREILVSTIRNTQCLIDNLLKNDYFSTEDAEIVVQFPTQADKVRKILDLVQSKGEEVSEYFILVLQKVTDAYYELQPWLDKIGYEPSEYICRKPVVNTDPVSRYCQKLRDELGRDSKFVTSYGQREDMLLEDIYAPSIMELVSFTNESLGQVCQLEALFDDAVGLINEDGETIYVFGDAGIGKSILLQRIQSLWARKGLDIGAKFFFRFRCRMFSCFKEDEAICLQDLLFKYNCYPDQDPMEVFHHILQFPHTVLFTFDGFDEIYSSFDLSSVPEVCSPDEPIHPLALLVSLLRGKLLKGSKKILTARTGTELQRNIIRKKVLLRGFSCSNLKEYTAMFFRDERLRALVLDQLEGNPNLCSLCSVPLFCWIIFKSYEQFHSMFDSHELPDCSVTLTDVFLLMIEVHLNRSLKTSLLRNNTRSRAEVFRLRKETLLTLGKLAYKGMENSFFIFKQEEVSLANISEEDLQLGFLRTVKGYSGCNDQATYEFLHLTLQSFFTAFFLVVEEKVSAKELLQFFNERSSTEAAQSTCLRIPWLKKQLAEGDPFQNNEHFHFTNLFLCGLLSRAKQKLLRHLALPGVIKRKRKTLVTYFGESTKSHLMGYTRSRLPTYNQIQVQPNFMWVLRCLYEMQSQKVGRLAARRMQANYIKLTYCGASAADCRAIAFLLHHFPRRLALDLDNNNINDYGVKQLLPCFSKLAVIRLSVNQVTDHGVRILCEELSKYQIVTFLGLYNNEITDVGAKYVANLIEECSSLEYVKYAGFYSPLSPPIYSILTKCCAVMNNLGGLVNGMTPAVSIWHSYFKDIDSAMANTLPGSSLSLPPSHMYGNRLNPSSAMAALIAQSENSQADQDLGDNSRSLAGRGGSPRGSLSPRSPVSSLQIRYDQSGNSCGENLPPVAASIEQLLERQWSEGQQFLLEQGTPSDILGMLKSLHQLQVENRRLEEQIKNLTAKKERLQLLNAQLSVPFPTITSNPSPSHQVHPFPVQAAPSTDSLNSSKSPHLGNSFLPDNSLPVLNQEITSSGQSTSSSSALSTPPPAGQSPAQQGSGVTGVQQVNGVTVGALASGMQTVTSTIPAVPGVGGIIGALPASQLAINGIVGALNGVIQTPATISQNPSPLAHATVPPNAAHPLPTTLNNSASGLGLLPDQQRQLLLHQQHQQFQQLLSTQQLTSEQHQALLYQLVQQQHHHHQHHQSEVQQLQITGGAQIPMNNLLSGTQASPLNAATTNPFLTIHGDNAAQKVTRLNDKTGPVASEKS